MSNPDLIEFIKTPWSAEAEALLQEATGSNPSYTINELRDEVTKGNSNLLAVVDHNGIKPALLGYVVAWVETVGNRELVLQAGAAFVNTLGHVAYIGPALHRLMRDNACVSMRAHTSLKAMGRALRRVGFKEAEVVYRFEG